MQREREFEKERIISRITKLWHPLTNEQIDCLRNNIYIKYFKKNEPVFKENERPSHVLCLIEGKVKIYINGIDGRNAILRIIKPLEFMGYGALVSGNNYHTSAICLDDSTIAMVPDAIMKKLVGESADVAMYFIRHLADLLGNTEKRTISHTQKHIRGRLAETLLSLKEVFGMESDGMTLAVNISRKDMAGMSNMTTSNAIRTLSQFADEGIIETLGKKIIINNEDELKKISDN